MSITRTDLPILTLKMPSIETPFQLSPEQKAQYEDEGYLVIPRYFSTETAIELKNEAEKILSEMSLEGHPLTKFSTGQGKAEKHVGDDYFLNSGDKIRFFFEEDAFNPDGTLSREPSLCVNKIGHALHVLNPVFRSFTLNESTRNVARQISGKDTGSTGFQDPRALQSMLILKQPTLGAAVPSHQDSTFLYTSPQSAMGFWYALEDCSADNGCLSFVKGSHKWSQGKMGKRFVRASEGGTTFETLNADLSEHNQEHKWTMETCEAGTLVLIHGSVVHKSEANRSKKSRFIYTFHVIEGYDNYDGKNWLQPTAETPFSSLNDVA